VLNGSQRCGCRCHWDLGWLRFGDSKIGFGDVDALFVVERHSRFFYLETKGPEEDVPDGQQRLLTQLSCVPGFTVVLLRGPKSYPETVITIERGSWGLPEPTDRQRFQRRIDDWHTRVNKKGPVAAQFRRGRV
jgi:hypothetical protein